MSQPAGSQCFEAAPTDWDGGADPALAWGMGYVADDCGNLSIATNLGVGTGETNTNRIIGTPACDTPAEAPAAWAARDYAGGSQSDWFLPSSDELNQLCKWARGQSTTVANQGVACDSTGTLNPGFVAFYYWSSSEQDAATAWIRSFDSGVQAVGIRDDEESGPDLLHVRPVRAF